MIDQAIEAQLEERSPEELAGAYRALCGMMLVYTAQAVNKRSLLRNDDAYQKNRAKQWVEDGTGILTFPECCEALDLRPRRARQAIQEYVPQRNWSPINTATTGG